MQRSLPGPSEILDRSWRDFSEHLGPMLGAVLIGIGIFVAIYIVLMIGMFGLLFLFRGNQVLFQVANNALSGVVTVVFLWGYIGYARFNLEIMRGAEPNLMTLFNQWRLLPHYFLTNALVTMISFLALAPFAALAAGPCVALWDPQNPIPAIGVGLLVFLVSIVVMVPLSAAMVMAALFTIDRELDPVASLMAGFRCVRGNILWTYLIWLLLLATYLATGVVACTGVGALVAIPFMTLVVLHCYEALAKHAEAPLVGRPAPDAPVEAVEPVESVESVESVEAGAQTEVGTPVQATSEDATTAKDEPKPDNPYAPPSAELAGPSAGPSAGPKAESSASAPGRPAPQPLPQDAHRYRPEAPARVTKVAIVCLIPWILAGGNPVSGAVVGFAVSRMLGFPSWAGAIAGFGGLTLCGVAALVAIYLGHRGRREAIVDEGGLVVDGNAFWTGVRIRWDELRGFQISPRGVEVYLQGAWGWIWRPIVPTRERETHDLVETLEGHGILRLE